MTPPPAAGSITAGSITAGSTPDFAVGIVGAGTIAVQHIQAWQALGARVLLQSPHTGRALASRYGLRFCADLAELFAAVDLVVVCTPTDTHFPIAGAAVEAGLPVLCEKPLTRRAADARRLVEAAAGAGVVLVPAHVVRHFPAYRRVADAVASGMVGTVQALRLGRTGAAPQPSGSWFTEVARSGGLLDLMVHDLDAARWLAGAVVGVLAVQHPPTTAGRLPDIVTVMATLTHRSGAVSQLHAMWGPPGLPFRTTVEVWGDLGSLRHDSTSGADIRCDLGPGAPTTLPVLTGDPFLAQAADCLAAVRGGTSAQVSADDGVAAVVLLEAVLESIATGQWVPVGSDSGSTGR
jgi:predicted dehydrogenase